MSELLGSETLARLIVLILAPVQLGFAWWYFTDWAWQRNKPIKRLGGLAVVFVLNIVFPLLTLS